MRQFINNTPDPDKREKTTEELDKILHFNDSVFDCEWVKKTLTDFTRTRAVYSVLQKYVDKLDDREAFLGIVGQMENCLNIDMDDNLGVDYFKNIDEHCEKLLDTKAKISFGYKMFDQATYGGIPVGDSCLFLFMAQPGLGKSMFMMNVAYNMLMDNKKVLMISLEMSEQVYSSRFDALFADTSPNTLKDHIPEIKKSVSFVSRMHDRSQLFIKEFPTGTLTSAHLRQFLKNLRIHRDFVPDVIFVDYLGIMAPNQSGRDSGLYEKGAKVATELRAVSCDLKIPIISAVQANRSGAGGGYAGQDLGLENVAESAAISATADAIFSLWQNDDDKAIGKVNVNISKNRYGGGKLGGFSMQMNRDTLRVTDWGEGFEEEEYFNEGTK